jgi:ABC-type multidrug transport system ATPase subunit
MIEITHVRKTFGKIVALDGVSLSIAPNERVGFVGPNGSGKTTLLRALLGLVRVDGHITLCGTDVALEPEIALRTVAYIPQIAPPLESPVREVVRTHAELRGMSDAMTFARAKKLGLDVASIASSRFRDLSGGTKQKLLAAMALATRAPILVCDEPTANLDAEARAAFFAEVERRPKGSITLLCSHRVEEVERMVDRVVELREGKVVHDGPIAKADLSSSRLKLVRSS